MMLKLMKDKLKDPKRDLINNQIVFTAINNNLVGSNVYKFYHVFYGVSSNCTYVTSFFRIFHY